MISMVMMMMMMGMMTKMMREAASASRSVLTSSALRGRSVTLHLIASVEP